MSFSGGSDNTTTSGSYGNTSTGNATNTQRANVPDWLRQPFQQYISGVGQWGRNNPGLPGANSMMRQSWRMADNLHNDSPGMQGANQTLTGLLNFNPQTLQRNGLDQLANRSFDAYMNPFTNQVTDRVISDQERARQAAINNGQSEATQAGAYGGSRHGVADSLTNSEYDRNTGDMLANLRMQNFNQAQNAAQFDIGNDINRRMFNSQMGLQGAQFRGDTAQNLGLLGIARDANARANIDTVNQAGQQQYQLSDPMRAMMALRARQGLLNMNPSDFFGRTNTINSNEQSAGTSTGTGSQEHNPGLFDWLQLGANVAGTFGFSDRRLKKDVTFSHEDARGNRWYGFRYLWDDDDAPLREGVMADEAPARAVHRHPSGYLMVDYGAI